MDGLGVRFGLAVLILAASLGLLLLSAAFSTCVYKRNYWAAFLGLVFPVVAWVGALRLARPNSWWARQFYGRGEKMSRAEARFGPRAPEEPDKGWGLTVDAAPRWPYQSRGA